jgi:iron complex outermembrane receptor protein
LAADAYMKNIFDTAAITEAFSNSDDTALSTNVFTTDPLLFGLRITKNW